MCVAMTYDINVISNYVCGCGYLCVAMVVMCDNGGAHGNNGM